MVSGYAGAPQFDQSRHQTKLLLGQSEATIQPCQQVHGQWERELLPKPLSKDNDFPHVIGGCGAQNYLWLIGLVMLYPISCLWQSALVTSARVSPGLVCLAVFSSFSQFILITTTKICNSTSASKMMLPRRRRKVHVQFAPTKIITIPMAIQGGTALYFGVFNPLQIIVYLQHFDRLTSNRNGPLNPIQGKVSTVTDINKH